MGFEFHPSLSSKGIIGRLYKRMESSFDASWVSRVGQLQPSNEETETYRHAGSPPPMVRHAGGLVTKDLLTYEMQIRNYLYETALKIAVEDIRRDKTGQINQSIAGLARRATQNWESLVSTLLTNGQVTTYGAAYDSHAYFDTDHEEGASGAQLNYLQAAQVGSLNVLDTANPTAIEMAQAISGMIGYLLTLKDDQGELINGEAREFLAMAGTIGIFQAVNMACTAPTILGAGNTQIGNPLYGGQFKVTPCFNPRMTTWSAHLGLFRTDGDAPAIVLQQETEPQVAAIAEGSELAITEGFHLYTVKSSRNAGYGRWQHAALGLLS